MTMEKLLYFCFMILYFLHSNVNGVVLSYNVDNMHEVKFIISHGTYFLILLLKYMISQNPLN